MFRGYRCIILGIAGLVLAANAQPIGKGAGGDAPTAQGNQDAAKDANIAAGVSRIGNALEAQNSKTDPYEKDRNEREVRDLVAQEKSAKWAEWMFYATAVAVILSIIGISLVWTTFRETRKSNDISREAMERQLRAFVSVDAMYYQQGPHPGFLISVKNFGSGPAYGVKLIMHYSTKLGGPWVGRRVVKIDIPPGQISHPRIRFSDADYAFIKRDTTLTVGCKLVIFYCDQFGIRYRSTFIITTEPEQRNDGAAGVLSSTVERSRLVKRKPKR